MPKQLPHPTTPRFTPSWREALLLVGVVVGGVAWYTEHSHVVELQDQLGSVNQRFGGMLDAEAEMRRHPERGPTRLMVTEFGTPGPRLRWKMDLEVVDEKPPGEPPAGGKAAEPLPGEQPAAGKPVAEKPADASEAADNAADNKPAAEKPADNAPPPGEATPAAK